MSPNERTPRPRAALAGILLLLAPVPAWAAKGGKTADPSPPAKKSAPQATDTGPAKVEQVTASPLDLPIPPAPEETPAPAPAKPPPEELPRWRITAGGSLDLASRHFSPTGGALLGGSYAVLATPTAAAHVGLRASYAPRNRVDTALVPGRGLDAQSTFYAHTGEVSATFSLGFRPFDDLPLELGLGGGAGLGWRAGYERTLGETTDITGIGLATHVEGRAAWHLTPMLALALQLELLSQPLPTRVDVPALPTDLGAFRTFLVLEVMP